MRALSMTTPSPGSTMSFVNVPRPAPAPNQVLVEVAAAGLNRSDVALLDGDLPGPSVPPTAMGHEFSGTVVEVGAAVERWRVGDVLCGLSPFGAFAEHVVVDEGFVLPIPDGVDVVTAAALPVAACTTWAHLSRNAELAPGRSLLMHGGASGFGSLAVQIAAAFGATVYATAGTDEKVDICRRLGCRDAVNYRTDDFVARVAQWTDGAGVDVIVDVVGATYLDRNVACLAPRGVLLLIGFLGGWSGAIDLREVSRRMATITAASFGRLPEADRRAVVADVERSVWPLIANGTITPLVHDAVPWRRADDAVNAMRSGAATGKLILQVAGA